MRATINENILCRRCVLQFVDGEYWYEPIKKSAKQSASFSDESGRKHRPFVTFVANDKTKVITQLTFDKTIFSKNHTADVSLALTTLQPLLYSVL
jgi:hypothetical protein